MTDGLKSDAVSFNRLVEEKAGRLYAVCLLSDAKAAAAPSLQHQGGHGVDPCLQLAVEHI